MFLDKKGKGDVVYLFVFNLFCNNCLYIVIEIINLNILWIFRYLIEKL